MAIFDLPMQLPPYNYYY